jgi:hypothetical protein
MKDDDRICHMMFLLSVLVGATALQHTPAALLAFVYIPISIVYWAKAGPDAP